MKHKQLMKRGIALLLLIFMLFSMTAYAEIKETLGDGKAKTVTVKMNERFSIMETADGVKLNGYAWEYTTDTGITGPAYCINWGLSNPASDKKLTIAGKYTASPKTIGAFANGYPQQPLDEFIANNVAEHPLIAGLTREEYASATQIAVWATMGQIAVQGTSFTTGRATLPRPASDTQKMRTYEALSIILEYCEVWDRAYEVGMHLRLGEYEYGNVLDIEHRNGLIGAEQDGAYGIEKETINGTEYYTRTFTVSSATSTYQHGYCIEVYADYAPEGTIFTGVDNVPLETVEWDGRTLWKVPTPKARPTTMNVNGEEYAGEFKICIPVRNTPENGHLVIRCTSTAAQYNIYLANNTEDTEQSFVVADPHYTSVSNYGEMKWEKIVSPYGRLVLNKTDGIGNPLPGAIFKLEGTDGSVHEGTTNADGQIIWEYLNPDIQYTLTETQAPIGYLKAEPMTVSIPAGQTQTVGIQNVSERTLRIIKVDAQNGSPLLGATFRLEQTDGSFRTDITTPHSGVTELKSDALPFGTYKAYELKAPAGYEADTVPQTFQWDGTQDITLTFKNVREPSLILVKMDKDTHDPLEGVSFKVYKDGKLFTTVTTDNAGYARVHGLSEGYYEVEESAAPEGYVLDTTRHGVHIDPYNPATEDDPVLVLTNEKKPELIIEKLDAETLEPMQGTTFAVYKDTTLIGQYQTNRNGLVELTDLEPGTYTVKEVRTDSGHVVQGCPQSIELVAGKEARLIFFNQTKPGISILKLDSETKQPLKDAVFRVEKLDGSYMQEFTTDRDGKIALENLEPGAYTVTELAAPVGYVLQTETRSFEAIAGGSVQLVFTNTKNPDLTIYKIDANTGEGLEGAVIRISNLSGSQTFDKVTDKNGKIVLEGMAEGIYTVQEITAPAGYLLNSELHHVTLEAGGENEIVIQNTRKPSLTIKKYDSLTGKPMADTKFEVYLDTTLIGTYITDSKGEILLYDLKTGTYTVKEIQADDDHIVNSTPQSIEITADSGDNALLVFLNDQKPYMRLVKLDSDTMEPLANAVFKFKKVGGTFEKEYTTDEQGEIRLDNLETGSYTVTEVKAPDGYLIADSERIVKVDGNEYATFVFTNTEKPSLKIVKTDALTDDPIQGVGFLVKHAEGGTENTVVTDENGEAVLLHLAPGAYEVTEKSVPDGYLIDTETKLVTLEPNRTSVVRFKNYPKPSLLVTKVDSVTKDALEGAKFNIVYASNNTFTGEINDMGSFMTDENGQFKLYNLKDGWYKITETEAPDGYAISEDAKEIYIKAGENKEVTFENIPLSGLVIKKVDGVTGKVLQGAKFRVRYLSGVSGTGGTVVGEYTTSVNGTIVINRLKAGTYVIEETKAPDGYIMNDAPETVYITGKEQDIITVEFENYADSGLLITKLDKRTGDPLYGAVFKVTADDGSVVGNANGRYTTDRNGQIHIYGLETDTYIVTEIQAPDGYSLDGTPQTIKLKSGETHELTFYNEAIGGIRITKVDEETGDVIKGVQFRVEYMNGERVGTYTTNSSGVIAISGLEDGWYTILETKAARGYQLDAGPHDVEVKDGKISRVTITNRKSSSFLIHKVDSTTGRGIYGVTFLVSDRYGNPVATYTSDHNGYVYMDDRDYNDGKYYVREISVPQGYVIDTEIKTFYVEYGETSSITWYNTPTQAQIQIIKKSADANSINGLPAGSLLEGAVFEIYDRGGNIVDTIKTDKNGRAASKTLPLGLYTVRETQAPAYYSVNDTLMTANLEFSGQIVTFEVLNKSVSTGVSITKTGYNEVMPNNPITYTFKNIANTSSVPLQSFYFRDTLPSAIRAEKLVTGTYNQTLSYKVVYLTNLSGGEYRTLNDNLLASRNYALDVSGAALGLASNEYITEIMFVFGSVPAGFSQVETPYLYARSIMGLPNGASFVNQVDVGGVYNGQWITSVSRWVTRVYNYTHFEMPRTGY